MLFSSLPSSVLLIAEKVAQLGGKAYLVGGSVRDILFGESPKDFDIEVYGLAPEVLQKMLQSDFSILTVGKHFAVFKVKGEAIDVSLPRRESTTGPRHRDFSVRGDPKMSLREAAQRRDFTINAMLWDISGKQLEDPLKRGEKDLKNRVLHRCSEAFGEDPLRVLRAMQFIARFDLEVTSETRVACLSLTQNFLPKERIWEEWKKLILRGKSLSKGLSFLRSVNWLRFYPDLGALVHCPQNLVSQLEEDVWSHTLHCLDAYAKERVGCQEEDLVVGFAVLCHDFGKALSTGKAVKSGIPWSQHHILGEAPSRRFLNAMTGDRNFIDAVIRLVIHHGQPSLLYHNHCGEATIRRLASKVKRIDRLLRVVKADQLGRPLLSRKSCPEVLWWQKKTDEMKIYDQPPKSIVRGRHLIGLGALPGKHFSLILEACWEAQMEGEITDLASGIGFVKKRFKMYLGKP